MRFYEILSGVRVFINEEEQELIDKIGVKGLDYKELDEREQEVARTLISRGVVQNRKDTLYTSSPKDLWRF